MALLTKLDEVYLPDHYYLTADDTCFYHGEYTARKGFAFSVTNQLIHNLKKSVDRKGKQEWQYKETAMNTIASIFKKALNPAIINSLTFVPIPPSKSKDDALYDDRMFRIAKMMGDELDVRELLLTKTSQQPSHLRDDRPGPDDIKSNLEVNSDVEKPAPSKIVLLDDVLTTGAHFIAAKRILQQKYEAIPVIGLFVARRAPETMDFEDSCSI